MDFATLATTGAGSEIEMSAALVWSMFASVVALKFPVAVPAARVAVATNVLPSFDAVVLSSTRSVHVGSLVAME